MPPLVDIPDLTDAASRARAISTFETSLRHEAKAQLITGLDGLRAARSLAASRVALLKKLFLLAEPPAELALLVTGGLGRGIAAPYSDLDLVFLVRSPDAPEVEPFLQRFLYPLWDAGLTVGHATHTPTSYLELAQGDLTVLTSALDRRPGAGDQRLTEELDSMISERVRTPEFTEIMLDAVRTWTAGVNSATAHRLEPDIKSGAGGLRTLHEVWWAARFAWGISDWRGLLTRNLLEMHDVEVLMYGFRLLLEVRLALHFEASRRQDVLRFEFQCEVAQRLGILDDSHELAGANRLLTAVYRAKRAIRSAADRALEVCLEALLAANCVEPRALKPVEVERHGQLVLREPTGEETLSAKTVMTLFRDSQRFGKAIHWTARTKISELASQIFTPTTCCEPSVIEIFMEILSTPDDLGASLESLHEAGILEKLLPEFVKVTGLVQRDLYHIYTVDAHLVQTGRVAIELMAGSEAHPQEFLEIAERVRRPHVSVMAALMHDIGKGHGTGHAERGAGMSEALAERLGWDADDTDDLVFLVKEHLSMMIISQRRDMEDSELVKRFAERVESLERLKLLTLLSYADAVSTGPEAYNDWKGALLRELYHRTADAIRGGAGSPGRLDRATQRRQQILMSHDQQGELSEFLDQVSARHVLYHRPSVLVHQCELLALATKERAAARVVADPRRKRWEVILVTQDRPGLLAQTAGVLASYGITPQSALLSVTTAGYSLDSFVTHTSNWPLLLDDKLRKELEASLLRAARDGIVPEAKLDEQRRAEALSRRDLKGIKPRIVFDSEASERATVIDVFAASSITLLRDISRTIFEAGASIELARITREGRKAVDAFYVVDATTREPLAEERKEELKLRLMVTLSET